MILTCGCFAWCVYDGLFVLQTGTPVNRGKSHSIHGATSMDHDHSVNEVCYKTRSLFRFSSSFSPHDDFAILQSNSSVERDGCSDSQVELVLSGIGEKHESPLFAITYRSKDPATLISEEMPSCATLTFSSAPYSGEALGVLFIDLETRFNNFVASFDDMNHRSSITIDSIALSLSGNQSSF
ncbi:hypothetical protein ACLB2K_050397 [Fragaria x ananassa]